MARRRDVHPPLRLPRRMAPTDALFWYAESALPILRPIIGGLYVMKGSPDPKRLARSIEAAVALVPRLRQRVVETPLHLGLPEWIDDPHFDREYHVRRLGVPAPGSPRDLLDLVGTLLATPLDRQRPLWEAYRIDGVEGGRTAFFFKMHHSVVDGVGSLALLGALTQEGADDPPLRVARSEPAPPSDGGAAAALLRLARDHAAAGAGLVRDAAGAPLRLLAHPGESIGRGFRVARGLAGVLQDLATPPVRDPLAEHSGGLSRRLDVTTLPLARLRSIKAPLRVSLNDVVLAALAGALGAYHRERRAPVDALNCMVPMNLRGEDEREALGNRVGMFNIVLPVSERDPEARLRRIHRQTTAAKSDRRGGALPFLLGPLMLLPGGAMRVLARRSLGRVNVACTNIPGVRSRRFMAGAEVEAIFPFASVVQGTPLVVALLSYGDDMDVGIDTDPEAIPDPHRITELFGEALDELEARAGAAFEKRAHAASR